MAINVAIISACKYDRKIGLEIGGVIECGG